MSYVYIQSESALWTVGHYDGSGKWQPESDHGTPGDAAARVAELNGGGTRISVASDPLADVAREMAEMLRNLEFCDMDDTCPWCGRRQPLHVTGCKLDAALARYDALTRTIPGDAAETR